MTGIAIAFLLLSLIVIWGGLVASSIFLMKRPQVLEYPPGPESETESEGQAG